MSIIKAVKESNEAKNVCCLSCKCSFGSKSKLHNTEEGNKYCNQCYLINTTCNKCKMPIGPNDSKHWYKDRKWHHACLPVKYLCSKYQCNQLEVNVCIYIVKLHNDNVHVLYSIRK